MVVHTLGLSDQEATALMVWLGRYREAGWPEALDVAQKQKVTPCAHPYDSQTEPKITSPNIE